MFGQRVSQEQVIIEYLGKLLDVVAISSDMHWKFSSLLKFNRVDLIYI